MCVQGWRRKRLGQGDISHQSRDMTFISPEQCQNRRRLTGLLGVTSTIARVEGVMSLSHSVTEGRNPLSGDVSSQTGLIPSIVRVILAMLVRGPKHRGHFGTHSWLKYLSSTNISRIAYIDVAYIPRNWKDDFVTMTCHTHDCGRERKIAASGDEHVLLPHVRFLTIHNLHFLDDSMPQDRFSRVRYVSTACRVRCSGAQRIQQFFWRWDTRYTLRHVKQRTCRSGNICFSPCVRLRDTTLQRRLRASENERGEGRTADGWSVRWRTRCDIRAVTRQSMCSTFAEVYIDVYDPLLVRNDEC